MSSCATGRMASSVWIGHLLFTPKPQIYRKRQGRVRPLRWRLQMQACFPSRIIRLEIFGLPFKKFHLFRKFPVGRAKLGNHLNSDPDISGILGSIVNNPFIATYQQVHQNDSHKQQEDADEDK